MSGRGGELIAANEPTVVAESLFDSIVMEDFQSDGRLPDPACTDKSGGFDVFSQTNNLVDKIATSETGLWRRGRRLARYARCKYKILDSRTVRVADLVLV